MSSYILSKTFNSYSAMRLLSVNISLGLLVVLFTAVHPTNSAEILMSVLLPAASSHAKSMSAIAAALTRQEHNVTILVSSSVGPRGFEPGAYSKAINYQFVDTSPGIHAVDAEIQRLAFHGNPLQLMRALLKAFSLTSHGCRCLFADTATLTTLKNSHFDVVIGDSFDGCDALIGAYLNIPLIAVTTGLRYPFFNEHVYGIPAPSSYVPFGLFPLTDRMSFFERVLSFIEHHVIISSFGWMNARRMNAINDEHGLAPGKDIRTLLAEAKLWLCVTSFALDFPRPTAPNWVAIGGINDSPPKPLQQEYLDFVEGSGEHGFIVFSLGTHFSTLPDPEMAEVFAKVFKELPQKVLWRYTGPRPRNLGINTKLVDWLPQNDLLGHPNVRLLIYHGGAHGVYEAVFHAVPMVIMPIIAEQSSNAVKVEARGMGRRIRKDAITYDAVKSAVTEVLGNPRYAENARRLSVIYRDTLSRPDETAVFWIEHVLKYGSSHLRTRATELNFIQLYSLDVIGFVLFVFLVMFAIICACCRRLVSCCCSREGKAKVE